MSSSSLILFRSFASLIVVLYVNFKGKDLKAFLTSHSSEIFSSSSNDSLAMSHNLPLKLLIVSSSLICKFSNFVVRSSNLDLRTTSISSKAT